MNQDVTIITATLNRPSLIEACRSINEQTYNNWHHYVIGDGVLPQDYIHAQRTTIGFSRRIGAEEPTMDMKLGTPNPILRWALSNLHIGKFVCFLDDDNAYHFHFLEKMISILEKSTKGIALCMLKDLRFTNTHAKNPSLYRIDDDISPPPYDGYPEMGRCDNSAFLTYGWIASSIGFPKASPNDDAIQDYQFIKEIADLHGWVRVPERLVYYGIGPNFPPPIALNSNN